MIKIIIPVRCFSCGRPVAHLWEEFKKRKEKGEEVKKIFEELGIKRYCCRSVLLSNVDMIDIISEFKRF